MGDYMDAEWRFIPPKVHSSNELVSVSMSGDAMQGGKLSDKPFTLVMEFDCSKAAKSDITVYVPTTTGQVAYGFKKNCKPGKIRYSPGGVKEIPPEDMEDVEPTPMPLIIGICMLMLAALYWSCQKIRDYL